MAVPSSSGSLDTNVVLRLLLNDVPGQHQAALRLLEDRSARFDVADTAVIEVAFVLHRHYGFSREQVAEAIEGLLSLSQVNGNRELFQRAIPLYVAHAKLSFEDCCLAAYAQISRSLPLWTFDQKLASQAPGARLVP